MSIPQVCIPQVCLGVFLSNVFRCAPQVYLSVLLVHLLPAGLRKEFSTATGQTAGLQIEVRVCHRGHFVCHVSIEAQHPSRLLALQATPELLYLSLQGFHLQLVTRLDLPQALLHDIGVQGQAIII